MAQIDPRGPIRQITKVERTKDATLVSMECGHTAEWAPHISGQGSTEARCFECGAAARVASK
jgi:hypothetical protein